MTNTVKTVKLHGFLGKKYGRTVRIAGSSVFQLMCGLKHRFGTSFKNDIAAHNWQLISGKRKLKNELGTDDLGKQLTANELHLVPVVKGANGAVRMIVGVILIVAGAIMEQPWMVQAGAALALGGAAEMLASPVGTSSSSDDSSSSVFNTAKNVTSQGGAIPLLYGHVVRASSVVISSDFSSDRV